MPQDRLDPFAILGALGLSTVTRATPVRGGADATLWRIDAQDKSYALRVLRPEQASQSHRELVAMTAAREGGVPVPAIHAAGTWHGHHAMVLAWCAGQTMFEEVARNPAQAHALGVDFGRTLAAIHALPAPEAFAGPAAGWIDWANPDDALRSRLLATARKHEVLLHLDYHPLNVLVDAGQVSAVLDWANARPGDPRADLARTASILHFAPVEGALPAATWAAARRALNTGWRSGYRAVAGQMRQMAPFYAWAGAVMTRDLAPRLGRPDLPWLTPAYLGRVGEWTAGWRARAGLPS
jgi:aminoglycoside phosphotransferase (APT) family kinase protein